MTSRYVYLLFILLVSLLFSCKHSDNDTAAHQSLAKKIKALEEVKTSPANSDSVLKNWGLLSNLPSLQEDTVLYATVQYNMGRLYAMRGNDSAEGYITKGLELIEPTTGNLELKARMYNGMGNIKSEDTKEHQANYYYNKAATIVLADSSLNLSPLTRSIMLISAAQSNSILFQYELAQQMNKAVLALSPQLPPDHINRQRVFVQIIQTLNAQHKPGDSIIVYLKKLEMLHQQYPDTYDESYLYECKVKYFEATNQNDSILHYQLLKSEIDQLKYKAMPTSGSAINNLFVDYVNIGGVYTAMKNTKAASVSLDKAAAFLKQHPDEVSLGNQIIYKTNLASLLELRGEKQEALNLMSKAYTLQRENYETENTQAIVEMNALYQLQAKDRSIKSLNENIKINELQLEQNRLWLIIVILVLVVLAIGFLFFYNSYRQRRAAQKKEQALLQQQLLRTQMEPHFIFNTLAAVQSFVRLDKKEAAIKYLNRFSRLLRSSLELSREQLVPLCEEMETLENYLNLQQMRFENAFEYSITREQTLDWDAVMIPPMLIQPFVENAILHGIDLDTGEGRIDVDFSITNEILKVSVTDSGKKTVDTAEPAHRSLSGTISRERISLLGKMRVSLLNQMVLAPK
ncbi:sensor histidine kinase [Niabella hibiscisoli]|uniref:sensor histidine kinase n=1 Tax=Niabella hibiscisoli TaxID=1825928 RepID=UPI001F0EB0D0|nr:histidine kinase [Niabella hibiscisoli]MCH5720098.1 histidine kinase [Niabella hibiscisoli]